MTINVSSPVTGGAQTGFTAPTYTLVSENAPPNVNGKQYAVTALGGTQTGVDTHSAAKPFTLTVTKPVSYKAIGSPNPNTGVISSVPMNQYQVLVRKGVLPAAGQSPRVAMVRIQLDIPAGSELTEPEDIRAAISLAIGTLSQQSAGVGDTVVTGILG